jgi:uncharacterized phage protein gp47/JayE
MAPPIPSLEELHARLVADYRARFPDAKLSRFSDNWKRLRVVALSALGVYHQQQLLYDELFPDTATGEALRRLGRTFGVPQRGATPARKANALRVFGEETSTVTIGDQLTSAGGLVFQVNGNGEVDALGFVDVDVIGVSVGRQTRLTKGEVLTFVSPPAGIDAKAELQLDLDEDGEDEESQGAYRQRILDRLAQPAMGGNANDYRTWALEVEGIAAAFVYPGRRGLGTVDLAALHPGRGSVRSLNTGERADLKAYIDARRPVAMKMFRVLETEDEEQDVELLVQLMPGGDWKWDWADQVPPVVAVVTGTTVEFEDDLPGDMRIGHRVTFNRPGLLGRQFVVEALAAAKVLRLRTAPDGLVAGDLAYSGGDPVDPIRDELLAFMDALGPIVGPHGVGDWIDELSPRRIETIAQGYRNVRKSECVSPAALLLPADSAYPDDGVVGFFTPRMVLVRRLW